MRRRERLDLWHAVPLSDVIARRGKGTLAGQFVVGRHVSLERRVKVGYVLQTKDHDVLLWRGGWVRAAGPARLRPAERPLRRPRPLSPARVLVRAMRP